MAHNTTKFPIDFDQLEKGSVVSVEELERIFGLNHETQEYKFALLALREQAERELHARGYPATVVARKDCLRVLTDEEAAEDNPRLFNTYIRRAGRSHVRTLQVDVSEFNEQQLKDHTRNCEIQGKQLAAIKEARKQYRIETNNRKTPGRITNQIGDEYTGHELTGEDQIKS